MHGSSRRSKSECVRLAFLYLPGRLGRLAELSRGEVPILAGATECLRETALIVMEVYNFQLTRQCLRFHEMCAHLDSLGFRCADLADPGLRPKDQIFWQADFFFLPKSSPLFDYPSFR